MFVPPYAAIAKALEMAAAKPNAIEMMAVPAALFRFMAGCLLAMSEFDERTYLDAYPDVAEKIRAGEVPSAFGHFVASGYFTGLVDGSIVFDEAWYLERYPDVAAGVLAGDFPSGRRHYFTVGMFEWRAPNPRAAEDLLIWRRVIPANTGGPFAGGSEP